jgi:acyl-CoA thioesterase II
LSNSKLPHVLHLERTGEDRFGAPHPADDPEGRNVVFSGQLLAQMIMAGDACFEGALEVKSIQAIFSRAGTYEHPMELRAETTHAGRTFGSSTITAFQGDRLLSRGLLLMNSDEPDLVRHGPMSPVRPAPETLDPDVVSLGFPGSETRTVPGSEAVGPDGTPEKCFWLRCEGGDGSVAATQAMLAWSQPGELIGLALRAHADEVSIEDAHVTLSTGVIAHTVHFQERFDIDDWLLVQLGATSIGRGRVYGEGRVFDRAGRLVSTFSQDSMVKSAPQNLDPKRSL